MNHTKSNRIGVLRIDAQFVLGLSNLLCVFICIFMPTSRNTEIFQTSSVIFVWGMLIVAAGLVVIYNPVNTNHMLLAMIFINSYMIIVSLLASFQFSQTRISLARIVPVISLIFILSMRIDIYPRFDFMRFLLHIVSIAAIIWNIAILFGVQTVLDFTYNNYNQYYPLCGYYQVILGHKPVMSFGVYTYAAYFYFMFFICAFATYKLHNKVVYLVYAVAYCVFCLLLGSASSIIFFGVMLVFLVKELGKRVNASRLVLIAFVTIIISIVAIQNYAEIYDKVLYNFTNGNNGFIGRYSSVSSLSENFKVITSSLGIGYNIIGNIDLSYSDSGYVLYLTMGSIPFAISIYYLLYKFMKYNFRIYSKMLMFIVFGFELALPATFNYRFSYMMIFVICYLGSLEYDYRCNKPDSLELEYLR